jgi:hypothetical protein
MKNNKNNRKNKQNRISVKEKQTTKNAWEPQTHSVVNKTPLCCHNKHYKSPGGDI